MTALREQKTRQLEAWLLADPRWDGLMNLVFTTSVGTPMDAWNVIRCFKVTLAKAGLPDMRWHDLRHSSATLLAQGTTPREVMEPLGHSQISLTMNTYAHVIPVLQRKTADRMDELFGT
jgi:integrase